MLQLSRQLLHAFVMHCWRIPPMVVGIVILVVLVWICLLLPNINGCWVLKDGYIGYEVKL